MFVHPQQCTSHVVFSDAEVDPSELEGDYSWCKEYRSHVMLDQQNNPRDEVGPQKLEYFIQFRVRSGWVHQDKVIIIHTSLFDDFPDTVIYRTTLLHIVRSPNVRS